MYDIVIVGGGIAGLNSARLLCDKNKICVLEKSDRLGGLIHTKHVNVFTKRKKNILKNNSKNKTKKNLNKKISRKIKYEAGGAVVYSYQKNMMDLIKKFDIPVRSMPVDNKTIVNRHYKDFWDGMPRKKPLGKESANKFFSLIKKLFAYIDSKGKAYCNKLTLEQVALEILPFKDVRFIEFCYGYAAEFRIANANIIFLVFIIDLLVFISI